MIKVDKKNKWALNIRLHIPIPSIGIEIISDQEESQREKLHFNAEKEMKYEASKQPDRQNQSEKRTEEEK